MQTVVVVIHLMVVLAMIGVVLLQRSEGGGLGIGGGGGGGGGFMSSRGTANVLTRATAILAAVFFVTSLALSILAGLAHRPTSIMGTDTPGAPSTPGSVPAPLGDGGGVLDTLRQRSGESPSPPSAPSAPAGPAVPQSQ